MSIFTMFFISSFVIIIVDIPELEVTEVTESKILLWIAASAVAGVGC